jgi:hypothetical protein
MTRAAPLVLALLVACTSSPAEPSGGPAPAPTIAASPVPAPSGGLQVVAAPTAPTLGGIRLAGEVLGITLDVVDPADDPAAALRLSLSKDPAAVLVVDQPAAIEALRVEIELARIPVIAVGGDLYSTRSLFRFAFQTTVPLRWEARVLAHYLVSDRAHDAIAVTGPGHARRVFAEALAEEGVAPASTTDGADAVLGTAPISVDGVQLALSGRALVSGEGLPPGTVTCAAYTWAGWAEPIPRVARFRDRFTARFGHPPAGFEQEGYDAVRAVAQALERTGDRGGDALVRELESFRDETFSSTPIRLGPDDHVFAEQSHLGLFAVAGPGEEPNPPEAMGALPWRPLMRTFTTNGKRVNLADQDVRVFFPNWGPRRPRPNYWRSEYGIVTRPDDPLH